jgi:hypothetical protein
LNCDYVSAWNAIALDIPNRPVQAGAVHLRKAQDRRKQKKNKKDQELARQD